jgi:hypothetical protein
MSNGFSIVPNTPQNWTLPKISDAPMDVRQQASMILANARHDANTSDIVKAAILPDSVQAAAFTNIDKVEAQLDELAQTNPKLAADVRAEVMTKLNPVQQGELQRVQDGNMKMGPDGRGFNHAVAKAGEQLPSQDEWLDRAKIDGHPDYARYAYIAGSEDRAAMKKAMDDVYEGRAKMPTLLEVNGPNWKDPNGVYRAQNGQQVMKGVGIAHDTISNSLLESVPKNQKSLAVKAAPLPVKIALFTVDAKLKYDELKAKGFSDEAARRGVIAGQAVTFGMVATGSKAGTVIGGILTSPTGPGAIGGAAVGTVAGGTIAGLIDWATGASDAAALKAANLYDGTNIK